MRRPNVQLACVGSKQIVLKRHMSVIEHSVRYASVGSSQQVLEMNIFLRNTSEMSMFMKNKVNRFLTNNMSLIDNL